MEIRKDKKGKRNKSIFLAATVLLGGLIVFNVVSLISASIQMELITGQGNEEYEDFDRHYVLITQDTNESVWREVLRGSYSRGLETGAYVEWYGQNLDVDFSREELMSMAIAADVDGIILEADEGDVLCELIDEAVESEIPVVTVLSDCYKSSRQSYVGAGSYNLGREYGRQIIKVATKETKKALVLMDSKADDSNQNIVINGIRETLANEGNHLNLELELEAIDSASSFGADEAIRSMLVNMEELPDIIVCLNEKNTLSVYQAAVDYNIVGQIDILGYYTSNTILQAVDKGILTFTVAIDFEQMGVTCVDALNEYLETGYVSDYFMLEVNTVNQINVKEYLKNASENQE